MVCRVWTSSFNNISQFFSVGYSILELHDHDRVTDLFPVFEKSFLWVYIFTARTNGIFCVEIYLNEYISEISYWDWNLCIRSLHWSMKFILSPTRKTIFFFHKENRQSKRIFFAQSSVLPRTRMIECTFLKVQFCVFVCTNTFFCFVSQWTSHYSNDWAR